MGFFDSDEKPKKYTKKTKEQVYKGLKGVPADTSNIAGLDPIDNELYNQIMSQYPNANTSDLNALSALADDLQLNNIRIAPANRGMDYLNPPQYMRKGELLDIDEMPKESSPTSFTKFLGRFDPFKSEVPLTTKERQNLPLFYSPERHLPIAYPYEKLGQAKDFRMGRKGGAELFKDQNLDFDRASNVDPRMLQSAHLNVNPQTLDEMISAPGTGKIRFKLLQDRLKKEQATIMSWTLCAQWLKY